MKIKSPEKEKKAFNNQNPVVQAILKTTADRQDPEGSYTGRPVGPPQKPTQDADDL